MYCERKRNVNLSVSFEIQLADVIRLITASLVCVYYSDEFGDSNFFEANGEGELRKKAKEANVLDATVNSIGNLNGKIVILCDKKLQTLSEASIDIDV